MSRRQAGMMAVLAIVAATSCAGTPVSAATGADVQQRIDEDVAAGKPVVVHVTVALCDNENQGIVPVPPNLGDGKKPASNLYWGALYGVRTYPPRAGWDRVQNLPPPDERILERTVFRATVDRRGEPVQVYLVADAWDGAEIEASIRRFLAMSAGQKPEQITLVSDAELTAGGAAHLVGYVGHNGLMEFSVEPPRPEASRGDRSALILACASRSYFDRHLSAAGAHPLLLTTGLMAPEAYTLDAAIRAWVASGKTADVVEAAAQAYHGYQKCGLRAARGLFHGSP